MLDVQKIKKKQYKFYLFINSHIGCELIIEIQWPVLEANYQQCDPIPHAYVVKNLKNNRLHGHDIWLAFNLVI